MTATNRHKATITLGLVTLGFAASHPFSHTFLGGLFASGCSAAMVGGLADWFAVSALFRRPLGIPFRTELIPRNRERITQAIIVMVEEELLTRENIKTTMERYDVAALIVRYLADYGGQAHISEFLRKVSDDALRQINTDKVGEFLAGLVRTSAGRIKLAPAVAQAIEWSITHGYADQLVNFLLAEAAVLAEQPPVRTLLTDLFAEARVIYEKDMRRRQFASQFFEGLGFTAAAMAVLAQREAGRLLREIGDPAHPWRQAIRERFRAFAVRLGSDPALQAKAEQGISEWLAAQAGLAGHISAGVELAVRTVAGESGRAMLDRWLETQVEQMVDGFRRNAGQQEAIAHLLRQSVLAFIDTHHAQIGQLVRERLEQYSSAALVDLIEGRVGNDLQMIRINGSVVGGLAGMLIFLLTYWW